MRAARPAGSHLARGTVPIHGAGTAHPWSNGLTTAPSSVDPSGCPGGVGAAFAEHFVLMTASPRTTSGGDSPPLRAYSAALAGRGGLGRRRSGRPSHAASLGRRTRTTTGPRMAGTSARNVVRGSPKSGPPQLRKPEAVPIVTRRGFGVSRGPIASGTRPEHASHHTVPRGASRSTLEVPPSSRRCTAASAGNGRQRTFMRAIFRVSSSKQ